MRVPAFTTSDIWALKKGVAESSLYAFLKQAWPHFDPSDFVDAWHIGAIADHLEAVNNGEIRRLLVNIPPRFGKTNLVAVAWPLWTWIQQKDPDHPLKGPGVRFLCASYGANKAQADGVTARRVIASRWFQDQWGKRVVIEKSRDNQEQYDTTAGGYRISTGIPESLGKGGAIRICFPYGQAVMTEDGGRQIGEIVERRVRARVPSLNETTGAIELKPIVGWHTNPGSEILRLTFDNGLSISCTPCHRFLVAGGEWKAAGEIPVGAVFPTYRSDQLLSCVDPIAPSANAGDDAFADSVSGAQMRDGISRKEDNLGDLGSDLGLPVLLSPSELPDCGPCPVTPGVVDIFVARAISKVAESRVSPVAVAVPDFLIGVLGHTDERQHHEHMDVAVVSLAHSSQGDTGITVSGIGAGSQRLCVVKPHDPIMLRHLPREAADAAEGRYLVIGKVRNREPSLCRLVLVEHLGWSSKTYCLTVEGNPNLFCGDTLTLCASNCDDPHKTSEVESKEVIASQIRAYDEVWRTRSNDPKYGAEVIIMQRLGEDDLSGHLLTNDYQDIVHLFLPLRYEPERRCATSIGFEDYRQHDGELLWPARFDEAWAKKQEQDVGAFAFAGQYQQRPEPRGGGILKREWWQAFGPWRDDRGVIHPVADANVDWNQLCDPIEAKLKFPPFSFMLGILDTALTEETKNDPSGLVLLGVWQDPNTGFQQVMLAHAWRRWLQLRDLATQVAFTCDKYRIDRLIIENRTVGAPIYDEFRRYWAGRDWGVEIVQAPGLRSQRGGKEARANSVTHLFEEGMVHAPKTDWAGQVIDECSLFPRGAHDEMVDCVVHGLRWLRDAGILSRKVEQRQKELAMERYSGRSDRKALYPV